ncbi:hypothetical protein KKH3_17310 [Pectobacterium actinidiae]|nr:hypothetical protein KKH3_17310 [Pectobacterium actinidiae]
MRAEPEIRQNNLENGKDTIESTFLWRFPDLHHFPDLHQ